MDNNDIIIPSPNSHWSLRFVDINKPFPSHILANATYKVIRFFYPPFAVEGVDLAQEVNNPELNTMNVVLFLGGSLFTSGFLYVGYKYFLKAKPDAGVPASTKSVPKDKPGERDEKDIAEPLADKEELCDRTLKASPTSTYSFVDADCMRDLTCELEQTGKGNVAANDEVKDQIDVEGDKQGDVAEQINRAVWETPISENQENLENA